MSVEMNHILCKSKKSNSSTVFLIHLCVNDYVPRDTAKDIRDLIVLFAYAKGDYNTAGTFVADTAGWQMQISVSLTESKINKFVNTQMSTNNVPVYLPYVIDQRWSIKILKREILKMNEIDGDLHEQYTLWTLRKRFNSKDNERYTWKFAPDVDDNMKMKKMYVTGGRGYFAITEDNGRETVSGKLKASEKYILSKDKPRHIQAKLYSLGESRKRYSDAARELSMLLGGKDLLEDRKDYTKAELFELWSGKDLTKEDPYLHSPYYGTWDPPKSGKWWNQC